MTGYGESAEKWFETVTDLTTFGFSVWVLERQGQGGSERETPWRDLGHVDSFDPDVAAVRALVKGVIRPGPDMPLVVLGHSEGGLVALRFTVREAYDQTPGLQAGSALHAPAGAA